jgi:hypothetical protein
MKVRVVTEANAVVGYQVVETEHPAPGQFRASLMAGPGQKLHEIEVAEDFQIVPSPEEIHKKLATHLAKKAAA